MRDGEFGEIYMSRGLCYKWRDTIGKTPVEPVPPGVDYDLWTGPAPMRPFTKNRFHYNWHWFWDYGNGDLGNQGIHEVDIARWGLGVKYPDEGQRHRRQVHVRRRSGNAQHHLGAFEFNVDGKPKMMTFEVRHWYSNHEAGINGERPGNTIGNSFYGSKGYLVIDNYNKYYSFMGDKQEPGPAKSRRQPLRELHRSRAYPQAREPERRDRRRRAVLQPDAPRQHFLPPGPNPELG